MSSLYRFEILSWLLDSLWLTQFGWLTLAAYIFGNKLTEYFFIYEFTNIYLTSSFLLLSNSKNLSVAFLISRMNSDKSRLVKFLHFLELHESFSFFGLPFYSTGNTKLIDTFVFREATPKRLYG